MPAYKNHFSSPEFVEETVVNGDGVLGTIRIKPSGVLWKPKGGKKFFSVSLEDFEAWITSPDTKSRRTKS